MDAAPHTSWVECRDTPRSPTGTECQAFCTCGWEMPQPAHARAEADRMAALHLRNAQRRALALPLGDLDEDAIRRVLKRTVALMRDTGAPAAAALEEARRDEVQGRLDGQLVLTPTNTNERP